MPCRQIGRQDGSSDGGISFDEDDEAIDATTIDDENVPLGGEDWRQLAHSVPNLRIYRVEKANDPFVTMPNGNEWVHCGHSIQLGDAAQQGDTLELTAHRFDRSSASNASLSHTLQKVASEPVRVLTKSVPFPTQGSSNGKEAIQSYVDKLITSGNSWFTEFSGMNGKGVSGMDNEMRTLAQS